MNLPPSDENPWRTFVRRFPPREQVESGLRLLVERSVDQLHVYTGGQRDYYNYKAQFWDNFASVDFRGKARLEFLPDADHTFTSLRQQALLVDAICGWLRDTWVDPRATMSAAVAP